MVQEPFVTTNARRKIGTCLGIDVCRDCIDPPQVIVKAGNSRQDMIDGSWRTCRSHRMAWNDSGGGVRPLEPRDETGQGVNRDLLEINRALTEIVKKEHEAETIGTEGIWSVPSLIQMLEVASKRKH